MAYVASEPALSLSMTVSRMTKPIGKPLKFEHGLTLIELMVSLVIGLLLAIIASSTYLYSKQAYNSVTENSQLEENGRFALTLLARNIQSAGFVAIDPASAFPGGPNDIKVRGCDYGMVNPKTASSSSGLACQTSTPTGVSQSASIGIFYDTDAYSTSGSNYQGFDCLGNKSLYIPSTTGGSPTYRVSNYFFVSTSIAQTPNGTTTMGQLSCATDPTGSTSTWALPQPLIPGIHQFSVAYLTPSGIDKNTAQKANTAATLEAANTWSQVTAVELCVLTKSIQPSGNDTSTQMKDCYDNDFTPPPSQTFRRFTTVVNLRNRTSS